MATNLTLNPRGLYTNYNSLSQVESGSLLKADNVILDQKGTIKKRRGIKYYGELFSEEFGSLSVRARQLLEYKGRIIRHVLDKLSFDDGTGQFTSFTGSYSDNSIGARIRGIEYKGNYYFTSDDGVKKISVKKTTDLNSNSILDSGVAASYGLKTQVILDGSGFLGLDTSTGTIKYVKQHTSYRVTWGYTDNNNLLIESAPSAIVYAENQYADLFSVDCTIYVPKHINTNYFFRLYRSEVRAQDSALSTEFNLIFQRKVTDEEINKGSLIYTDSLSEESRAAGIPLYVNPYSGDGEVSSNFSPPFASDITLYQNHIFYANTRNKHTKIISLQDLSELNGSQLQLIKPDESIRTFVFQGKKEQSTIAIQSKSFYNSPQFGDYFLLNSARNERRYFAHILTEDVKVSTTANSNIIAVNTFTFTGNTTISSDLIKSISGITTGFNLYKGMFISGTGIANDLVYIKDIYQDESSNLTVQLSAPITGLGATGVQFTTSYSSRFTPGFSLESTSTTTITDSKGITTTTKVIPEDTIIVSINTKYITLNTICPSTASNISVITSPNTAYTNGRIPIIIDLRPHTFTGTFSSPKITGISGTVIQDLVIGQTVTQASPSTFSAKIESISQTTGVSTYEITLNSITGTASGTSFISESVTDQAVAGEFSNSIAELDDFLGNSGIPIQGNLSLTSDPVESKKITQVNSIFAQNLIPGQIITGAGIPSSSYIEAISVDLINSTSTTTYYTITLNQSVSYSLQQANLLVTSFPLTATTTNTSYILDNISHQFINSIPLNKIISGTGIQANTTIKAIAVNEAVGSNISAVITKDSYVITNIPASNFIDTEFLKVGKYIKSISFPDNCIITEVNSAARTITINQKATTSGTTFVRSHNTITLSKPTTATGSKIALSIGDNSTYPIVINCRFVTIQNESNGYSDSVSDGASPNSTGLTFVTVQEGLGENKNSSTGLFTNILVEDSGHYNKQDSIDITARSVVDVINNDVELFNFTGSITSGSSVITGISIEHKNNIIIGRYIKSNNHVIPAGTKIISEVIQTEGQNTYQVLISNQATGTDTNFTLEKKHYTAIYLGGGQISISNYGLEDTPFWICANNISDTSKIPTLVRNWFPNLSNPDNLIQDEASDASKNSNALYFSKRDQPESVPLGYQLLVGSSDEPILRIIPLRESLFIFKTDGLFRLTGYDVSNFSVTLFDNTAILKAVDSAVVLRNQIYFFGTQGVSRVSEGGIQKISNPIDDKLIPFITSCPNLSNLTFGISYETDESYLLWTAYKEYDTIAKVAYRYNLYTDSWVEWNISKTCAVLNSNEDKLYFGSGEEATLEVERKNFNRYDFCDREILLELPPESFSGTLIVPTNGLLAGVGDIIYQLQGVTINQFNQFLQIVSKNAYSPSLVLPTSVLNKTTVQLDSSSIANLQVGDPIAEQNQVVPSNTYITEISDNVITLNKELLCSIGDAVIKSIEQTTTTLTFFDTTGLKVGLVLNATSSDLKTQVFSEIATITSINGSTVVVDKTTTTAFIGQKIKCNITYPMTYVQNKILSYKMVGGDNLAYKLAELVPYLNTLEQQTIPADSFTDFYLKTEFKYDDSKTSVAELQLQFFQIVDRVNTSPGFFCAPCPKYNRFTPIEGKVISKSLFDNKIILDREYPFLQGSMFCFKAIPTNVIFVPQTGEDASSLKQFQSCQVIFNNRSISNARIGFSSDVSSDYEYVDFVITSANTWGNFTWDTGVWGGEGDKAPLRTYVPARKQRCRFIQISFVHLDALENFNLYGLSLSYTQSSDRAYR
jgi:hypothetical protein